VQWCGTRHGSKWQLGRRGTGEGTGSGTAACHSLTTTCMELTHGGSMGRVRWPTSSSANGRGGACSSTCRRRRQRTLASNRAELGLNDLGLATEGFLIEMGLLASKGSLGR
jgi:hypothetical protein